LLTALASGQPWRFAYNLARKMAPNPVGAQAPDGVLQSSLGGRLNQWIARP
jgi:hypothetical protein